MTRFLLVRHGQTAWNEPERFRGREDLPLNEMGRRQAESVARRIARDWPDVVAVYASPLQRTMQTAEAIAHARGLTPQPLAGLLDLDYGAWQGLSHQEAAARYDERSLHVGNAERHVSSGGEVLVDAASVTMSKPTRRPRWRSSRV